MKTRKILLAFTLILFYQMLNAQVYEGKYELLTLKGETFQVNKIRISKEYVDFNKIDGGGVRIKKEFFYDIRELNDSIPELKINKLSFEPIIVKIPNKSAEELYNNAIIWINKYYKNPSLVLKSDIPGKSIRIEAYDDKLFVIYSMGVKYIHGGNYVIKLDFKDGKYRLTFYPGSIGYDSFYGRDYGLETYIKKDGTIKKSNRIVFKSYEFNANKLSYDIYYYLNGVAEKIDNNW